MARGGVARTSAECVCTEASGRRVVANAHDTAAAMSSPRSMTVAERMVAFRALTEATL
jgi:hypothetical protein